MRYWKAVESCSYDLKNGKIYISDDDARFLKGEDNVPYKNLNVANGDFNTKFQEVTKEDYEKQCEIDETEADLDELCMGYEEYEKESNIHPKHYQLCSLECIDTMLMSYGGQVVYDFCMCNAFKYIWRHENKNGKEDIEKARYYVDKAIEISVEYELYKEEVKDIDMVLKRLEEYM